jgi:hypothetical protein
MEAIIRPHDDNSSEEQTELVVKDYHDERKAADEHVK